MGQMCGHTDWALGIYLNGRPACTSRVGTQDGEEDLGTLQSGSGSPRKQKMEGTYGEGPWKSMATLGRWGTKKPTGPKTLTSGTLGFRGMERFAWVRNSSKMCKDQYSMETSHLALRGEAAPEGRGNNA